MKCGLNTEVQSLKLYDAEVILGSTEGKVYPEEFQLERFAEVKDQGDTSGCLACTLATIGEYYWHKKMSEGWTYAKFRKDTQNNPGLYASSALEAWKNVGMVPQSEFGIMAEMKEIKELASGDEKLLEIAEKYRIKGYASLNYANAEKKDKAIKEYLTIYGIPLVGASSSYFGEPHAIPIDGWTDTENKYKFQNSWGKKYGNGGYDEIPKNKLTDVYAVFFEPIKLPFKDVKADRWSAEAIKHMYFNGLMNGTAKDTFEPEKPLTREEMAVLIDRLCTMFDGRIERIFALLNEINNMKG